MALTVQCPQVPLGGTHDTRVMPQDHHGEKTGQTDGCQSYSGTVSEEISGNFRDHLPVTFY